MFRPIFSASHSSQWVQVVQRHPEAKTRAHDGYWRQQGVTAHGEVWTVYSDAETETVVDEFECRMHVDRDDEHDRNPAESAAIGSHALGGTRQPLLGPQTPLSQQPSSPRARNMAPKTYFWISLWFSITIPLIFWDAAYCFFRPHSFKAGSLHWVWPGYELYEEVDYVYGTKAYENGDGFVNAQATLNIIENLLNCAYMWLSYVSRSPAAPLVGFTSVVMTVSKTVLYWLQEYFCGGCSIGHNDLRTLVLLWVIPNGAWIAVPSLIMVRLGKDIIASLRAVDKSSQKKASGKQQ